MFVIFVKMFGLYVKMAEDTSRQDNLNELITCYLFNHKVVDFNFLHYFFHTNYIVFIKYIYPNLPESTSICLLIIVYFYFEGIERLYLHEGNGSN